MSTPKKELQISKFLKQAKQTGSIIIDLESSSSNETVKTQDCLPCQPQTRSALKQEDMVDHIGLWVNGMGGNNPVAIFHQDFAKMARSFAEQVFPNQHIIATVKIPTRRLINRNIIGHIGATLRQQLSQELQKPLEA